MQRIPGVTVGVYTAQDAKVFEEYVSTETKSLEVELEKLFASSNSTPASIKNIAFQMAMQSFSKKLLEGPKAVAKASAVTDSDGRFTVQIPGSGHHLVAAVTFGDGAGHVTIMAWSVPQNSEGVYKLTKSTAFWHRYFGLEPFF